MQKTDSQSILLRKQVKYELMMQEGTYEYTDRDRNVRIVEDIRKAIDKMVCGITPSAKHIAEVVIATNENLQIRDFILGMECEKDIEDIKNYISIFLNVVAKEKVVPLATIFCKYLYQTNSISFAKKYLDSILEQQPDYNLAKLMKSAFNQGWSPEVFINISKDLHTKTLHLIYELDKGDKTEYDNSN